MKKILQLICTCLLIIGATTSCDSKKKKVKIDYELFDTSDTSLHNYETPKWFRDAKLGIFLHWGVGSQTEMCGWYSRWMYYQNDTTGIPDFGKKIYTHHLKTYGHPSEIGFKDIIPTWKAEKWNPDALVTLFKEAGAKYIVPLAVHHDNFDNFDSSYQEWNSVNMGPKRDIIGDWAKATRKQGLRFGASSHAGRSWRHHKMAHASDTHGKYKDVPYDGVLRKKDGKGKWWEGFDPQELYGVKPGKKPDSLFLKKWYNRTTELYDKYDLDLLYFDGIGYQLEKEYRKVIAGFYNTNRAKNNGKLEAVINIKNPKDPKAVVHDYEKGVSKKLVKYAWQTDTPLSSWYYIKNKTEIKKPASVIVDMLIDIVSKNGNLLLNVAMKGDGTLDESQTNELKKLGEWLSVNGEAIYGTRPWKIYGEGPTKAIEGHYKEFTKEDKPYTSEDIRFTTKGAVLYAIALDIPKDQKIVVKALAINSKYNNKTITNVSILGDENPLIWEQTDKGLRIQLVDEAPSNYAISFKIEF